MLSSLLKFPKKFADPVKKEIGLDFGTKLVNEIAGTRLRAFLLNRLKITPGTVTRLIKRYQVKVIDSMNRRLHPTMLMKLPQSCTVQLQGFRLPQRSAPLFPSDDIRWDVMKKSCFSNILKETFEANPVNAPIRLLYEDATLLAINKPYNIPFDEPIFIGRIKEKSNCSEGYLRVLNRLEPNETGVLLFAKKETIFNEMSKFFHQAKIDDQVQPVYWAMTTSVYKETPFGEIYSLHYRGRGDHRPRFSKEQRWTSHQHLRAELLDEGESAISQWRHLSTHIARTPRRKKLGLYEIAPLTLRSDQIRVQLTEQLKCPVLGDWLYSPKDQLKLRMPPKYPLHLHLYALRLKSYFPKDEDGNDQMLEIKAPIPPHFVMSMNKYTMFLPSVPKLKKPKLEDNVKKTVDRFHPGMNK